jgi:hypothetical protein
MIYKALYKIKEIEGDNVLLVDSENNNVYLGKAGNVSVADGKADKKSDGGPEIVAAAEFDHTALGEFIACGSMNGRLMAAIIDNFRGYKNIPDFPIDDTYYIFDCEELAEWNKHVRPTKKSILTYLSRFLRHLNCSLKS